jgi:anti-sigma factor RsiW
MSLEDHEIIELHELLDALVENNLPKDKLRKLETWIEDDEEVRRYYIEFMDMSVSLGHYAEELLSDETEDCITD